MLPKKKSVGQGKRTCAECRCAISSKGTGAKLLFFFFFENELSFDFGQYYFLNSIKLFTTQ
jgi:hypothetical protein